MQIIMQEKYIEKKSLTWILYKKKITNNNKKIELRIAFNIFLYI